MARFFIAMLLLTFAILRVEASPSDDLSSLDPAVRAAAAEQIRTQKLYHSTDNARWKNAKLSKGDSTEILLQKLEAAGATYLSGGIKIPSTTCILWQLDDSWSLSAYIHNGHLLTWNLVEGPRYVYVAPPAHYAGKWTLYHLDGSSVELNVSDGKVMPK
jgi:hypothetical protein